MTNEERAREIANRTVLHAATDADLIRRRDDLTELVEIALDEAEQRTREACLKLLTGGAVYTGETKIQFRDRIADAILAMQEKDDDPCRPLPPHTPGP